MNSIMMGQEKSLNDPIKRAKLMNGKIGLLMIVDQELLISQNKNMMTKELLKAP